MRRCGATSSGICGSTSPCSPALRCFSASRTRSCGWPPAAGEFPTSRIRAASPKWTGGSSGGSRNCVRARGRKIFHNCRHVLDQSAVLYWPPWLPRNRTCRVFRCYCYTRWPLPSRWWDRSVLEAILSASSSRIGAANDLRVRSFLWLLWGHNRRKERIFVQKSIV